MPAAAAIRVAAALALTAAVAAAQDAADFQDLPEQRPANPVPVPDAPAGDALPEVPETVYDTPPLRTPGEGFNDGALTLDLSAAYATDYVFRGVEPVEPDAGEDAANLQFDARVTVDLGRLPDPFARVFTNTADGDDVSNFQVIRPTVGFAWQTDPFDLTVAHQSFTYPDRDALDTAEVFVDLRFNDAQLVNEPGQIFGPYVFAAYDYDAFEGVYVEAGLDREQRVGESDLTLGLLAAVAYVDGLGGYFGDPPDGDSPGSGLHHWRVEASASYELNELLNLSRRYGRWSAGGFLAYADGIDDDLRSTTQLYGGAGLRLRY